MSWLGIFEAAEIIWAFLDVSQLLRISSAVKVSNPGALLTRIPQDHHSRLG